MQLQEFEQIKRKLMTKMKFMDTTLKGVKDSIEYKENSAYNSAIRDCIKLLEKHTDALENK